MRVQTGTAQGPGPPASGQQSLKESSSAWPKGTEGLEGKRGEQEAV